MRRGLTGAAVVAFGVLGAATTPVAFAQDDPVNQHRATVAVQVHGLSGGEVDPGDRVTVTANLRPYQDGEKLKVVLLRDGKPVESDGIKVRQHGGKDVGQVSFRSKPLTKPGRYVARVIHFENPTLTKARESSKDFRIDYPALHYGESGQVVAAFNDLLNENGYGNAPNGDRFNSETGRAVHAFRKVNGMSRNETVTADLYHLLATGRGKFRLEYPNDGHHVEIDISRQVMVLADEGEAKYTFHVSTGKSSTPSDQGYFHAQWKDPGYNSLGMYYSVYYNGGEATHGYASVPDYAASHGCVRNPIPDSIFIYNWIQIGDPVIVYS